MSCKFAFSHVENGSLSLEQGALGSRLVNKERERGGLKSYIYWRSMAILRTIYCVDSANRVGKNFEHGFFSVFFLDSSPKCTLGTSHRGWGKNELTILVQYVKLPDFCFYCGEIGHHFWDWVQPSAREDDGRVPLKYGEWLRDFSTVGRGRQSGERLETWR